MSVHFGLGCIKLDPESGQYTWLSNLMEDPQSVRLKASPISVHTETWQDTAELHELMGPHSAFVQKARALSPDIDFGFYDVQEPQNPAHVLRTLQALQKVVESQEWPFLHLDKRIVERMIQVCNTAIHNGLKIWAIYS